MTHAPITLAENLQATAAYILRLQLPSGALPWFAGGITDPWDHVEAVMGLTVAGHHQAALKGFDWLANNQREDGAWFAAYQNNVVADDTLHGIMNHIPSSTCTPAASATPREARGMPHTTTHHGPHRNPHHHPQRASHSAQQYTCVRTH